MARPRARGVHSFLKLRTTRRRPTPPPVHAPGAAFPPTLQLSRTCARAAAATRSSSPRRRCARRSGPPLRSSSARTLRSQRRTSTATLRAPVAGGALAAPWRRPPPRLRRGLCSCRCACARHLRWGRTRGACGRRAASRAVRGSCREPSLAALRTCLVPRCAPRHLSAHRPPRRHT